MAETVWVPLVGATAGAVGLVTVLFALYVRNRPSVMQGPLSISVSLLTVAVGTAVLLLGEAAHGADMLVYIGGVVALVGIAVLTGVIALYPHPEGEADVGH